MMNDLLLAHMEYLSAIMRNEAQDVDGLPPTLADRIAAGGCLITIHTIWANGFDLDIQKTVAECKRVYGDRFLGPKTEGA